MLVSTYIFVQIIYLKVFYIFQFKLIVNSVQAQFSLSKIVFLWLETWGRPRWGSNVKEFIHRFDSSETKSEGPRRLKNLYFLYLVELRALSKVASYFERSIVDLYTGNSQEDTETKSLLLEIFRDTK